MFITQSINTKNYMGVDDSTIKLNNIKILVVWIQKPVSAP